MKYETGRSMVEMLATLSIIGVLSVGAVAGFKTAMNKHKANELIQELKMHSVSLAGQALSQNLPENMTLNNTKYQFVYKKETDKSYSLSLNDVDKNICRIVQNNTAFQWAETVLINDGKGCENENNSLVFFMNTSLTSDTTNENRIMTCQKDSDCGECGQCGPQNVCLFSDLDCIDPEKPYCNKGKCQSCEVGNFRANDGICYKCSVLGYKKTQECFVCSNRYASSSNDCYLCLGTVTNEGKSCDWNCSIGEYGAESQCFECNGKSVGLNSPTDSKTCRENCKGIRFRAEGPLPGCIRCDNATTNNIYTYRSDCLTCSQRYMEGTDEMGSCGFCTGFVNLDGTACHSCDSTANIETTEVRCQQCQGQRYYDNGLCILCPQDISNLTDAQQSWCL